MAKAPSERNAEPSHANRISHKIRFMYFLLSVKKIFLFRKKEQHLKTSTEFFPMWRWKMKKNPTTQLITTSLRADRTKRRPVNTHKTFSLSFFWESKVEARANYKLRHHARNRLTFHSSHFFPTSASTLSHTAISRRRSVQWSPYSVQYT